MDVDKDRLSSFMGKMLGDFGAAANAALIKVGDRLGLYKVLAAQGPMTSQQLCKRWLVHQLVQMVDKFLSMDSAMVVCHHGPRFARFALTQIPSQLNMIV